TISSLRLCYLFFSHAPPPTPLYTLSLHDALPISGSPDLRISGSPFHAASNSFAAPTSSYRFSSRSSPSSPSSRRRSAYPVSSMRSEENTSELQSPYDLVCRLLLEKKNTINILCPH